MTGGVFGKEGGKGIEEPSHPSPLSGDHACQNQAVTAHVQETRQLPQTPFGRFTDLKMERIFERLSGEDMHLSGWIFLT